MWIVELQCTGHKNAFQAMLISFHPDSADSWGVNCESVMLVEAKTRDA